MKIRNYLLFSLLLISNILIGQTVYTSIADGNYRNDGTWSTDGGATACSCQPPTSINTGDSIVIKHDLSLNGRDLDIINGSVTIDNGVFSTNNRPIFIAAGQQFIAIKSLVDVRGDIINAGEFLNELSCVVVDGTYQNQANSFLNGHGAITVDGDIIHDATAYWSPSVFWCATGFSNAPPAFEDCAMTSEICNGPAYDADISVNLTAPNQACQYGDIYFFIDIDNNGPDTAYGVFIENFIPAGVTLFEYTIDAGATWIPWVGDFFIDKMANGDVVNLIVHGNVNAATTPSLVENTVTIGTASTDSSPGDNIDSASSVIPLFIDLDGDNVASECDLDDDNDGIPDIIENSITIIDSIPSCATDPVFDFSSIPTLIAGADLQEGAVYRFSNVSPGVDALVTIEDLVNLTIPLLDDNGTNPMWFNPQSAASIADSGNYAYQQYLFQFVNTGTTTAFIIPASNLTFNDVDGNPSYGEQSWAQTPTSYTADDPTDLSFEYNEYVVGTADTSEYPGVTGNFPQANYYARYENTSQFRIRFGVIARSDNVSTAGRQHSLSFTCPGNFVNPYTVSADKDRDGIPNFLDLDSDNDGIFDAHEAGHGLLVATDGTISGASTGSGLNGLFDGVETSPGSDTINYNVSDSELSPDQIYDPYELDSDGDGCYDVAEENLSDPDYNGIVGGDDPAIVDSFGLVVSHTYFLPPDNYWQDPYQSCFSPCYLIGDGDEMLTTVDLLTNLEGVIGDYGLSSVEAIEFDPLTRILFGADGDELIRLDTLTAAPTVIGEFSPSADGDGTLGIIDFRDIDGLARDPINDKWYASGRTDDGDPCGIPDVLFQFDPLTGNYIPGAFGDFDGDGNPDDYVRIQQPSTAPCLHLIDDLGFDPFTGKLYGIANGNGAYFSQTIVVTIDPLTGNTSDPGNVTYDDGSGAVNLRDVEGLTITLDNRVLVTTGGSGNPDNALFEIFGLGTPSITATRLTALMFDDYEGLTCLTFSNPATVGEQVYIDVDLSGDYSIGDTDIPNVLLNIVNTANGALLGTRTTDIAGKYYFTGLLPGTYRVDIAPVNYLSGGALENYFLVVDPDGPLDGSGTTSTLPAGGADLTMNFGYSAPLSPCTDPSLLDTDSDGINDVCDLDDDNDGIPDEDECFNPIQSFDGLVVPDAFFHTGSAGGSPVILDSIEILGTVYKDFTLPDSYNHDFSGNPTIDPNDIVIYENGVVNAEYTTSPDWNVDALPTFLNLNMNHYQYINNHDMLDGFDYFQVGYSTPILVNEELFVTVSERTGNNSVQVQAFDNLLSPLGPRFDVHFTEYEDSGVNIDPGNQDLEYFTIPLDDLAAYGSLVSYIRIYDNHTVSDAADLKVIIFGEIAKACADTDNDGIVNSLDLDSDNDGIFDLDEAGHSAIDANDDGIIDGAPATFGTNGLFDGVETSADSDTINYNISNSETSPDSIYDAYELDSDADGCYDAFEASVLDADDDGIAGNGVPTVDTNGLVTTNTYVTPANNDWQDPSIYDCAIPYSCDPNIYIASSTASSDPSQLSVIDVFSSPFILNPIGAGTGSNYNALGYRNQDDLLYGIKLETNELLRIDANGVEYNLGPVTGLPAPTSIGDSYDSGDVFPDGYLYVHEVSTHSEMYQIDVTTTPPSLVQTNILSQAIWLSDFAYNSVDGKAYGIGDMGQKYMIDPSTWIVSSIGANAPAASYGAAYTNDIGQVFIYRNNPGAFFLVDFGLNGTGTGNMTLLSLAPNVSFNDGASCRGAFVFPEICTNGVDDDGDGLIDCFDPDCDQITLNNTIGACIDHPLEDIAQLTVDVSWTTPLNDTLEILVGGSSHLITMDTATSPTSVYFNVPADGSIDNIITASWGYYNSGCSEIDSFDAPIACSNDSIACNILYFCGDEKPSDGDAWDHGWIEYLDNNNGTSIVDAIYTVDEPGQGTYDPMNPATFINIDYSNYDLIIVSASTEDHISSDLVDVLKDLDQSIILSNYLEVQAFDLSNSAGFFNFDEDLYIDNANSTQIYNFNNPIDPLFDNVFTHLDYRSDATAYLWNAAGAQVAENQGVYVHYEASDVFPSIAYHGPRTYFGFHMNQLYANQRNGGPVPTSSEYWFHPARDLTLEGKLFFDQMIIEAASECGISCQIATMNPHIMYYRRSN